MRSQAEHEAVALLVAAGRNDCEISRTTGIPRGTVRDWRRGRVRSFQDPSRSCCPVCAGRHEQLPARDYAYLLGQYLGDGHVSCNRRGIYRMRVACCTDYPMIMLEVGEAMQRVRPANRIGYEIHAHHRLVVVSGYSKHWGCLIPQRGPGPKHARRITLAPWQQAIVDKYPHQLLRGLVHSDGWRGTNRVTVSGRTYEYPRHQFTNASADIRRIFCDACDQLGVEWRRMNATNISVARRAVARRDSVALLDEFIGPKR